MSEGGEGGTDEMRQRLKQYLQNKKGAMISSTGASARTTSGKVVKVSRTKPVTAAKVSLRPEIQRTTQEKPPMLAHTGRVSCTKASVPPQPTVNCAGPLDLSQARLRLLHRLVQERPEFAPPVIESVAHFTSVTDVELHRKAMREMSRLLGPVVEWVREAVERLLNLHNRITHEQQVIIYESEDLQLLMVDVLTYRRQAELAMELTNHLPEWTTLKHELEALFAHFEALSKVTDAHNNYLTLNSI